MMTVLQNAFANSSSSLVVSKVQGNIVDLLMPPIGPGELLVGLAAGGMTRGIAVGLVAALVLGIFGLSLPAAPLTALAFPLLGSLAMALPGCWRGSGPASLTRWRRSRISLFSRWPSSPARFIRSTGCRPFDSIATMNPFFYAIDGFRYGLSGLPTGRSTG